MHGSRRLCLCRCPFDYTNNSVVLRFPGSLDKARQTWRGLSNFQQSLYLIDEVEAQWQRLMARYAEHAASLGSTVSFHSLSWDTGREDYEQVRTRLVTRCSCVPPGGCAVAC